MQLKALFYLFISMGLLMGISACSGTEKVKLAQGELALLHSINLGDGQIVFTVTSHGCTTEKDFEAQLDTNTQPASLHIFRNKADYCRRAPFSKKMMLAVPNVTLKSDIDVINEVSPFTGKKMRRE